MLMRQGRQAILEMSTLLCIQKRRQKDDDKNSVLLKLLAAVLSLKKMLNYFRQRYDQSISKIFYGNLNFWRFLPIGPIVQRSAAVPS